MLKSLRSLFQPKVTGIYPEKHKLTATAAIAEAPLSSHYILPLKQHIGEICTPLVRVGDRVLKGQKIAKSQGYLSAAIHAPTSGIITKIGEHAITHPSGLSMESIFIEADGNDQWDTTLATLQDWKQLEPSILRERVRLSGIAGLGGAVFPTFIKLLQDKNHPIESVILNGAECEPYLTNDHRLMVEHSEEIVLGLQMILHMVKANTAIIAIEDNKPDAIACFQRIITAQELHHIEVKSLPSSYPQGSEKQLIEFLTKKQVPAGKLPLHIGLICQNVGTTKAIHDAILWGKPLIERVVTVSGDAMPNPGNMRVRLGTPIDQLLAWHGLENMDGCHLIHGGPMMGERLGHAHAPVVKATNAVLAFLPQTMMAAHKEESPCIRCGDCSQVCPASLTPNLLADLCRQDQFEKVADYHLFDCIECGCCSYVCPSHIPLVHYFRYGKGQLATIKREKAFADESRQRSSAKEARIQREKEAKEAAAAKRKQARAATAPVTPPTQPTEGQS
ncbi:MAG: electron transport complex subunit RsxC [Zetaproteobacteria bacterium]|nr:electron transport complex subunit RsxC [Zetaproteobacteria bacterium]